MEIRRQGSKLPWIHGHKGALEKWCYVCARHREDGEVSFEKEHVVPREVFAPHGVTEFPATLWICPECHHQKTLDERFAIRAILATAHTTVARERRSNVIRVLKNGHDLGVFAELLDHAGIQGFYSPGGVYLGDVMAMPISENRMESFLARIAKGLWVRHTMCLSFNWDDYDTFGRLDQAIANQELFRSPVFSSLLREATLIAVYDDVFAYRGHISADSSYWFMQFWESHVGFVEITHKKGVPIQGVSVVKNYTG